MKKDIRFDYVCCLPTEFQEQIRKELSELISEENYFYEEDVERSMNSKLIDLEDIIDISKYIQNTI